MLISKHFDPVIGIDIHFLIIPPAGPVPIPHPHIALVFDPFDYVPFIGATVKVGGLPRSTAGTAGKPIPHIPMGGPFAKPPMNENEIFMGSVTVLADGGPLSYTAVPSLSCHDIGLIAPPRKKKPKKSFGMVLPTSVVLSIPLGMPVMVGGAPTIDMMGLAMMGGFAALGGAFKKLRKMQKKSPRIKKMSDAIHNRAKKAMDQLGVPPNVRNKVHKGICTVTGHPVDVATGKMFTDHVDFSLPGPLPLVWERTWYSTSVYDGPLGHGWHHSYDVKLCEMDNAVAIRLADGRSVAFPALDINEACFDRQERMTLLRDENGYALDTSDKTRYRFTPFQGQKDNQLLTTFSQTTSGAVIHFYYNDQGQLNQIIDSGGRLIRLSYTDDNRIHKIYLPEPESNITRDHTNPKLFCVVEHHYRDGMLVRVDDALQQPLQYHYDHKLLIKETFRSGLSFYFEYDGLDHNARCLRTWGDEGIYYRDIRYDTENNITWVKNSLGHITTYYHNGVLPHRVVNPLGHESHTEYNGYSEIICETNELGYKNQVEFDTRGNKIRFISPDGSSISLAYDEKDNLIEVTDKLGNPWRYIYNEHGELIVKTDPLNYQITYHHQEGLLRKITDSQGTVVQLSYDQNANLVSIADEKSEQFVHQYDALGNLLGIRDARNNVRRFYYDKLKRVICIDEADGNRRSFRYDAGDNIIYAKDQQYEVVMEYVGMGRLALRTQAGTTIRFEYNREEQITSIINEHGHVYQYEWDANEELIRESGFDGLIREFVKDASGRTLRINRPDSRHTLFNYDNLDRLTQARHSDGALTTFKYRKDDELIEASNNAITLRWELDAVGQILKEFQGQNWVTSEYDARGLRTRITSSIGLDQTITRNAQGDAIKITTANSQFEALFERDQQGLEIQRSLPGGIRSKWTRDKLGRPIKHEIFNGKKTHSSKTYLWGVNNRLLKLIDSFNRETVFQHDASGSLISARYSDNNFELRMPDAVGNLFKSIPCNDREYGPAGQLLAVHSNKGTTRYHYDAEGNLVRKIEPNNRVWCYEWNGAGHMAKVVRPDGKEVIFQYDPLGRRIRKSIDNKTTCWIWDGNNPLHEWVEYKTQITTADQSLASLQHQAKEIAINQRLALLQQIESQGPPKEFTEGSKEAPVTWLFEPDSFAPMAKLVGDEHFSIITDHLGTPNIVFDKNGNQVWSTDIGVWGELRNLKGARDFCPFRFPGQYEDPETGLYYNRFRYYDPEIGQYISQDPIGLQGRNPTIYGYVFDSSIEIDPFGLDCKQKRIGDWGEKWAKEQLENSGKYKKVISVQNGSNHGIDLVGIRKDGKFDFFEIKTNTTGTVSPISDRQKNATEFIQDILGPNKAQKGGWGVTPAEAIKMADPANMGDTRIVDIFIKNGKLDKVLTSVW
jgi:RHS repeat-associated protein